jgi:hypothetical protein
MPPSILGSLEVIGFVDDSATHSIEGWKSLISFWLRVAFFDPTVRKGGFCDRFVRLRRLRLTDGSL